MEISFGYIITFISLIYGLALTHALSCVVQLIQNINKIKNYWLWWLWAFWFFCLALGFWVSVHSYWHDCVEWSMMTFGFVTIQACLFYLCFYLFFNTQDEINNNLEEGFNNNKRLVFILVGILFFLMFVISPIISNSEKDYGADLAFSKIFLPIIFSVFAFIKNKIANYIFAFFMLGSFLLQIILTI
jgi:hypothetical protein